MVHLRQDVERIASIDFDEKSRLDYESATFKRVLAAETVDGEHYSSLSDHDFRPMGASW